MAGLVKVRGTAMLAALALLAGCGPRPTHDPATLKAIRAEAQALAASRPVNADSTIPEAQWPHGIAALRPQRVWADKSGVGILIEAEFDDSFGYFVPRDPGFRPANDVRYQALGEGVFWFEPS